MKKMVPFVLAACVVVGLAGCSGTAGDNLLKSGQETWAYILGILGAIVVFFGNPGAYETGSEVGVVFTYLIGIISLAAGLFLGFS